MTGSSTYRGRFAPSPTGSLHFGSLVAAVASYLAARHVGGEWLVRIEDVDRVREVPRSAAEIIATLTDFAFEWTGSIVRQSTRDDLYQAALERLVAGQHAYSCSCSRKVIAAAAPPGALNTEELHYPGWCRNGPLDPTAPCATRFRVPEGPVRFTDDIQGEHTFNVADDCGDFVLRRRDGLFAYQLAVTVDDAEQGITHVVRGADLLSSTPRQVLLQRALGLPQAEYAHVPLAIDRNGVKLSKSAGAGAIDRSRPAAELWRALTFLQQSPPLDLQSGRLRDIWEWGIEHWTTAPLRRANRSATVDRSTERAG
jgi:glutamyl-Q tRNA(Asp) synthetase